MRDAGDYRDGPQGGPVLWGTVLVVLLAAVGAFGWSVAQACIFAARVLGL